MDTKRVAQQGSESGGLGSLPGDIARDESRKAQALNSLFRMVSGGAAAVRRLPEYLEAAGSISPDAYVAACDELRETWMNTYAAPQPGHILDAAKRYMAKSRVEVESAKASQLLRHWRRGAMTRESISAHLAKVHGTPLPDDPAEAKLEAAVRASLTRILDRMEGRAAPAQPRRKRGAGGLQSMGDLLQGEV